MTLRQYLIIMSVATLLCWIAWGYVLFQVDPFQAGTVSFAFFYASLFLALLGTVSSIAFAGYYFFARTRLPMFRYVHRSFRDACAAACIIIGLLYLQSTRWLSAWNWGLLAATASIAALFFATNKRRAPEKRR